MRQDLVKKEVGLKMNYLDCQAHRLEIERDINWRSTNLASFGRHSIVSRSIKPLIWLSSFSNLVRTSFRARRERDAAAK
jgi:hypothetical protein